MTAEIPVTIVGGYLGAGKTTLINQMLRQANGTKLAILVNEFGALPIDEDLIEAQDDALISIAGGCICCSFGSDLTAAMLKLAALAERPDHIVIETSGVALPGSIAVSITVLPQFSVDGICVLADCEQVGTLIKDEYIGDTIARQFEDASLLLLTKSDLIDDTRLSELQQWLASRWPHPRQIVAHKGQVSNAILLGQHPTRPKAEPGGHHDLSYDSVQLSFDHPVDARALAQHLRQSGLGVLRAKGFVNDLSGRRALVQIVGAQAEVNFPEEAGQVGLICIGLAGSLDTKALQALEQSREPSSVF